MPTCVFCAIAAGDEPARVLHEDDATMAFLDINPVTRGHALVIPRSHAADMWDVDEEDATAVMRTSWHVARMLRASLRPVGLNLFQATRGIAGQTVFHLHVHVLPRYDAAELSVGFQRSPGDPDELDAIAERIRAAASG
jgi:histidine triad (HIT) family protein